MKVKWRKWNNIIHRDLGYLMVGLTIIYAVSGFMLNHKNDWNPNYSIDRETLTFAPLADVSVVNGELIDGILEQIGQPGNYTGLFRPDPQHAQVFYNGKTLMLDLVKGIAVVEKVSSRKVLREINVLHLNNVKQKLWTYIADFYAFALLLLAITGLFVLKGKKGITGRGALLTAIGVVIPIILLIIYT
jgi:hypothetical protein